MSRPTWPLTTCTTRTGKGRGYGDPLRRQPEKVAADLAAFRVSPEAASEIYGVVIKADGTVDAEATETRRQQLRQARIGSDVV